MLEGLDVDVGCSSADRFEDDEVDEVDERRLLRHAVEFVGVDGLEVGDEVVAPAIVPPGPAVKVHLPA